MNNKAFHVTLVSWVKGKDYGSNLGMWISCLMNKHLRKNRTVPVCVVKRSLINVHRVDFSSMFSLCEVTRSWITYLLCKSIDVCPPGLLHIILITAHSKSHPALALDCDGWWKGMSWWKHKFLSIQSIFIQ